MTGDRWVEFLLLWHVVGLDVRADAVLGARRGTRYDEDASPRGRRRARASRGARRGAGT